MLVCPNCQHPVASSVSACGNCGADFSSGSAWAPQEKPAPKRGERSYLGIACLMLALSPVMLALVNLPVFWLLDCDGNVGTSIRCLRAPWFSDFATTAFGLGVWGAFFTAPTALLLFLIGAVARHLGRRS
jgi:hypothetical protein